MPAPDSHPRRLSTQLSRREFVRLGVECCAAAYGAVVLSGCCPSAATVSKAVQSIEAAIQSSMTQYSVPSVSYALMSCGHVAAAHAFGTAQEVPSLLPGFPTKVPATPDTLYQAASLSKTLAAVAALWAVQQGKVTLDGDISNLLTTWKLPAGQQSQANPVTLRRLLGMMAGTNVHGFNGYQVSCNSAPTPWPFSCPLPTLVQILNGTFPANNIPIKVVQTPGSQYAYSGGGYEIVEMLLGNVTGSSYASICQNQVFNPLKMTNSSLTFPLPPPSTPILGAPPVPDRTAWGFLSSQQEIALHWNTYPEQAAAGLWTTPSDLAKLLLEISAAYVGTGAVLTKASGQDMMTPVGTSHYGLGGAISNAGTNNVLFMKNGSNAGFTSWFVLYPNQGNGIVIMTNLDGGNAAPANWGNLFGSAVSAAVAGLSWPGYSGLCDCG